MMVRSDIAAAASRLGVSVTIPELEKDIDAQIRCLLDPEHPKLCVFLARGNSLGKRKLPKWIFVERRPEGILLTESANIATTFRTVEWLTDEMLAAFLGYPEAKSDVIDSGDGVVVQTVDKDGCVIFEAVASRTRVQETINAARLQIPAGGYVHITDAVQALARRFETRMN